MFCFCANRRLPFGYVFSGVRAFLGRRKINIVPRLDRLCTPLSPNICSKVC